MKPQYSVLCSMSELQNNLTSKRCNNWTVIIWVLEVKKIKEDMITLYQWFSECAPSLGKRGLIIVNTLVYTKGRLTFKLYFN